VSDIKLFHLGEKEVKELKGTTVALEKSLQSKIERHLDAFFGITFLASEYSTGKVHGGRIDTLGLDENNCPVIIEYKRAINENVINQGLYYLDWLMNHKEAFVLLVRDKSGKEMSDKIDWSNPRLLCIAGDFNKYDINAVQQINRNIDLIRYKNFGELLLFELVNAVSAGETKSADSSTTGPYSTVTQLFEKASPEVKDFWERLKENLLNLGDDVQLKELKSYFAFKKIRNFACVEFYSKDKKLAVSFKAKPGEIDLGDGFVRELSYKGHIGTGDYLVFIKSMRDIDKAMPLLTRSCEIC